MQIVRAANRDPSEHERKKTRPAKGNRPACPVCNVERYLAKGKAHGTYCRDQNSLYECQSCENEGKKGVFLASHLH